MAKNGVGRGGGPNLRLQPVSVVNISRAAPRLKIVAGAYWLREPGSGAALFTVGDFHPATLSRLGAVGGNTIVPLGVDRLGQPGDIPDLYRARAIDTDAILDGAARTCLTALRQTERTVPAFRLSTAA